MNVLTIRPQGPEAVRHASIGACAVASARMELDHLIALRTPFEPHRDVADTFSEVELSVLRKVGTWMNELACGRLVPTTAMQEQMVRVMQRRQPPSSALECLWMDYHDRYTFVTSWPRAA